MATTTKTDEADTLHKEYISTNVQTKDADSESTAVEGAKLATTDSGDIPVGREHLFHALPPHESYEGRHRWDPDMTWTDDEEKKLVRKTDLYLLSWLCVMFFGLQLDRGNLQNALTDDLLKDLKVNTNDYNNGTTIQLLAFLCAEFPVQLLTKRYGFRRVLPVLMMAWSTVSWAQAFMTNRTGFYITRALIGACEGGFIPGVVSFPIKLVSE